MSPNTYYPDGSRASMTTPAGTYNYTYDDGGNLFSISFPWGQTVTYDYDAANRIQHQYQSQIKTTYTFDVLDELTDLNQVSTALNNPVLAHYSGPQGAMTYDVSGNRTGMQTTVNGLTLGSYSYSLSGSSAWTYDETGKQDQLISEAIGFISGTSFNFFDYSSFNTTYQSDGTDNLVTLRGGNPSYNADNQYVSSHGSSCWKRPGQSYRQVQLRVITHQALEA